MAVVNIFLVGDIYISVYKYIILIGDIFLCMIVNISLARDIFILTVGYIYRGFYR